MLKQIATKFNSYDENLCERIFYLSGFKSLDKFMYLMSRTGDGWIYFIIGITVLFYDKVLGIEFAIITSIAFGIELTLQKFLKMILKRERPGLKIQGIEFLINPPDQFSFPSGHTAGAYLIASMLFYFFSLVWIPVLIWATLVGFSRVYNGVHYPSDVLSGAILGIISAAVAILIYV